MKNLFIIGGWSNKSISSCCVYNIISNTWSQIPDLNEARERAACAVFEGRIVVTGGYDLKSVEQYDYYENKWTYLPDMIEERSVHAAVSMGSKMFVIGGYTTSRCEMFDSISRKFTLLRAFSNVSSIVSSCTAACISNYIIVFFELSCKETFFELSCGQMLIVVFVKTYMDQIMSNIIHNNHLKMFAQQVVNSCILILTLK